MRKQWKISAQRLLTLSAFGILTGVSATGFYLTGFTIAAEQTKSGVIIASTKPASENKPEDSLTLAESMRIHIEFLADPLISATDIAPSVRNGKMILKGNVNNNTVANNAVALASRLTTCKVISEIRTWPVSFNKTDKLSVEALQANTNKVVSTELLTSYPKLTAAVSAEGTVIVSGPVVTLEDKLEISKRLRKVAGCQRVINKMAVQPMRMGKETVTMVSKDGTKWIVGKDQIVAPTPNIQFTPASTTTKEITQAVVSTKTADKIAPVIVPTQNSVQTPKPKETTNTSSKGQRPAVLPESLVPVTPVAKPLPTPEKTVDVFAIPKLPQDWTSKKSEKLEKKEEVKPGESTAKTVTKTVEAKPASKTTEKAEEFPSFPNLNKKPEKTQTTVTTPVINKDVPVVAKPEPVAPKKELPKVAAKKDQVAPKVIVEKKEAPKIVLEKEPIKAKIDTVTKSATRVFMPAHDPIGSSPVKADMLGFPLARKEAPTSETQKPLLTDKVPTRYATNSDKDGDYNRPYLAAKTQVKPINNENIGSEKASSVVSKPAAKQDTIADIKPSTAKMIATSETQASTVSNGKNKTVPTTTASKKVESNAKPNVTKGSITFDSDEGDTKTITNSKTALTSLRKQVEQVCGKKASSVQVIEKPDGSRVLLIDVAQGSKQEDLAKTLFSMPEIAENNVTIEFIIK
ncbi:MAG: BON domain-containing protein [Planctomycetia bacterium]|nr:BON domain-containing protein [Planctomycetia bacterium]